MIKIHNLCKSFNAKKVINNLDLSINENELTFITGTSGVGKSTLLYLIGRLEEKDSGTIEYDNLVDSSFKESDSVELRSKKIGFVFQNSNLLSGFTVKENLHIILNLSGIEYDEKRVLDTLKRFGIDNLLNQKTETLSGGEKQRVSLAACLLKKSKIILADEPTGNLDQENSRLVMDTFKMIKDEGLTIIIVSHDLELSKNYADRIIKLDYNGVVSDEFINEKKDSSNVSKSDDTRKGKLNFKSLITLSAGNIKKKLSNFIIASFGLSLSIAMLISVLSITFSINNLQNDMNKSYLETDLVTVQFTSYSFSDALKQDEIPTTISDLKYNENDFEFINQCYDVSLNFENDRLTIREIQINTFFEKRIMANDITGSFIKNDNEIILAKNICEKYNILIGDEVMINNGNGGSLNFVVSGINNTVNVEGKTYTYICTSKAKEFNNLELAFSGVELNSSKKFESHIISGGLKGSIDVYDESIEVIGTQPKQSEILLPFAYINYYFKEINYTPNHDIEADGLNDDDIQAMKNNQLVLTYNKYHLVTVSGFYKIENKYDILINEEEYEDYKNSCVTSIEFYTDSTKVQNKLSEDNDCENVLVNINYRYLQGTVVKNSLLLQVFIWILFVMLAILSIILINMYVKFSITERTYDIGLLKSYGAKNIDIFKAFTLDNAIISIISVLFGLVFAFVMVKIIPLLSDSFDAIELKVSFVPALIGLLIGVIIPFASSIIPIAKALRMDPIEAMQKR